MATLEKDPISGTYIVKTGDSLSKIAATQGRTLEELLATNPQYASNPNLIRPGEVINISNKDYTGGGGRAMNSSFPLGDGGQRDFASTLNMPAPAPVQNNAPSYGGLTGGGSSGTSSSNVNIGGSTGTPAPAGAATGTRSFTDYLIQMLKEAQGRDSAGQGALMKQSEDMTKQGLTDAGRNFNNPLLSPSAGTSLGMSAQNEFDPGQLSIANQQKLASQNLGNFSDLIKQAQTAYDNEEERIARAKEQLADAEYKKSVLAEQIRSNKAGESISRAKDAGGGAGSIKLTPTDRQGLLAAGFLATEIPQLEADINKYGINVTLEGITDPIQKAAIMKVYGGVAPTDSTQFLTKDFLKSMFTDAQLKESADAAGYRHLLTSWSTEKENYLDYLVNLAQQYRLAGYTDKEILKLMQ